MYAYNPRKKSFEQLEQSMVGKDRWDILETILQEMDIKKGESPKQHWMIFGPRGIGKSHLMTLLYHKVRQDDVLKDRWIPVLFPEEIRMAGTLYRFLQRALEDAVFEYEKTVFENPIIDEVRERIEQINKTPQKERPKHFFSLISRLYEATGRHIVLIAENLQQLLGARLSVIEQKKLRAYLQKEEALLIIGTATTVFEALHDHSHPFYHFFHVRRLQDLSLEDMKTMISRILSSQKDPAFTHEMLKDDARLKAIYTFTGGNPRVAVFLADILRTEVSEEMIDIMDRVLDELTPYYMSVFDTMPNRLAEIIDTLAAFEPAQSPAEIAKRLERPAATVRNYLMKLKDDGYVRMVFSKGKSNYYCLNEYLYRVWYQMRDSGHREENRWILELLLMVYSKEDFLKEKKRLGTVIGSDIAHQNFKSLIDQATQFMKKNPGYCEVMEWCVLSAIPKDVEKSTVAKDEANPVKEVLKLYADFTFKKEIGDHPLEVVAICPFICLALKERKNQDLEKLLNTWIAFVNSHKTIKEKETEVMSFALELFALREIMNIESRDIETLLERLRQEKSLPYSDVISKIWTCLSVSESVEAQRLKAEKSMARVIKEIRKIISSLKEDQFR